MRDPREIKTSKQDFLHGWWGKRGLRPNTAAWFDMCPRGHVLPNRKKEGRCTPWTCVVESNIAKRVEKTIITQQVTASAETEEELRDMQAAMQAWADAHPLPAVPEADVALSQKDTREYIKQRLLQVAPAALERRIRTVLMNPGPQGEKAAQELLDRAGFTRRPEADNTRRSPVVVVNMKAGDSLPWLPNGVTVDAHSSDAFPQVRPAALEAPEGDAVTGPEDFWEGVSAPDGGGEGGGSSE